MDTAPLSAVPGPIKGVRIHRSSVFHIGIAKDARYRRPAAWLVRNLTTCAILALGYRLGYLDPKRGRKVRFRQKFPPMSSRALRSKNSLQDH